MFVIGFRLLEVPAFPVQSIREESKVSAAC
jgi:hypothetical protein